jgi:hypothetical protein
MKTYFFHEAKAGGYILFWRSSDMVTSGGDPLWSSRTFKTLANVEREARTLERRGYTKLPF